MMIVVVEGTTSFQQLALQGLYSLQTPESFGVYGTNPFWQEGVLPIHTLLASDGLQGNMRLMLVGHSYGAALSMLLAATYQHGNQLADLRLLTFGAPKPGDESLRQVLNAVTSLTLANDDDIVTVLPPDRLTLAPVAIALATPLLYVWDGWIRPPNQIELFSDGTINPNGFPTLDFPTLLAIANDVLTATELNPVRGHSMDEYLLRLGRRCDGAVWPVSTELTDYIDDAFNMLLETGADMLLETGADMLIESI
jgi:pimeloyl-ACP methyl ester carboxylesterase